jgi:hypothetical protein
MEIICIRPNKICSPQGKENCILLSAGCNFTLPMPCSVKIQVSKLCLFWVAKCQTICWVENVTTVVGLLLHCRLYDVLYLRKFAITRSYKAIAGTHHYGSASISWFSLQESVASPLEKRYFLCKVVNISTEWKLAQRNLMKSFVLAFNRISWN